MILTIKATLRYYSMAAATAADPFRREQAALLATTVRVLGAVRAVGVVWVVRVPGGPGTHWQPLNTL